MLTLVVAIKRVAKSTLVTVVVLVLFLTLLGIASRGIVSPVDWLARTLLLAIEAWILIRYGLLATMTAMAIFYAVNNSPLTLDWSRWYAVTGFAVVTTVAAALVLSWRLARVR
jgi:energy-converting hydrogenase Eha subunit H